MPINLLIDTNNLLRLLKDATILFSTMEKLAGKGPVTLFFVSANITDFSKVEDDKRILHPAIQARFPSVTVEYFETMAIQVRTPPVSKTNTRSPIPASIP